MTEPPQQPEGAENPEAPAPPPPYPAYPTYPDPSAPPQAPPPPYGQAPYGQPAYPQPPYAQPPYGQPPYPPSGQDPYAAPKPGTNGFAIAALVLGIIPICFLGVVFGIVALVQTSKTRQKGKGMAIAGLVLTGLWVIGLVTLGIVAGLNDADRDHNGTITHQGRVNVQNVRVGDCITDLAEGAARSVTGVPCSTPHQAEVYASLKYKDSDYPGEKALSAEAEKRCSAELRALHLPLSALKGLNLYWFRPTEGAWSLGDRHLTCMVFSDAKRTGSFNPGAS